MMDILFTDRSKLIKSVLQEPVTHVAIRIKDRVYHSNLKNGLHAEPYSHFVKMNKVVYAVKVKDSRLRVSLASYVLENLGARYDVPAAIYLSVNFLLRKIGINIGKVNLWQTTGMFLCTEFVTFALDHKEDSLITPYGLYKALKST